MVNKRFFKNCTYLFIIVAMLSTSFSGCTKSNTIVEEATKKPSAGGEQTPTAQPQNTVYKVGDSIKLGNNKLTVNEVVKSQGSEYDKPKSGNEYVIVKVTVENAGDSNISYNPYDFKVQNSQGQLTDQAITIINQDTALPSGELVPGGKVTGTIAFEEPKDDPALQLQYTPSYFSGNVIRVDLQK